MDPIIFLNLRVHQLDQHYRDNLVDQNHLDHLCLLVYHVDQVFLNGYMKIEYVSFK